MNFSLNPTKLYTRNLMYSERRVETRIKHLLYPSKTSAGVWGGGWGLLTLSSIYTHFNTLKKKAFENIVEKGEIAQMSNFTFFQNVLYAVFILKSLIATFQLSSAASLNLG